MSASVTLIEKFTAWLSQFFDSFLIKLKIAGIEIVQFLIDTFVSIITWVLGLFPSGEALPSLPSTPVGHVFTITMQTLNWLFPITFIVQVALWLGIVYLAYLVIAPLARWAKLLT